MTKIELIEQVARAMIIASGDDDADYTFDNDVKAWAMWSNEARAALRVIAPAVLREALGELTILEIAASDAGMRDYVNAFRDANNALRNRAKEYSDDQ